MAAFGKEPSDCSLGASCIVCLHLVIFRYSLSLCATSNVCTRSLIKCDIRHTIVDQVEPTTSR